MKKITEAKRLAGFKTPAVWSLMTFLANKTQSINLGQGFPAWSPPEFFEKFFQQSLNQSQHQYTRAFGSIPLVSAISEFHKNKFPNLDPEKNIVAVNGGVEGLFSSIMGIVDEGDEVIIFDPAYDCYRAQIQMAGGKAKSIALRPKQSNNKQSIKERSINGYFSGPEDEWYLDFGKFEEALTDKTKMVVLNSPHNPVGKIFSNEELAQMARILEKYPKVVVVEDNVYQGMTFDDMFEKELPKMAFQKNMQGRTLSVYSGGKIFSATGARCGWVIGNQSLIKSVCSVHQYNVYCGNGVIESTVAKSLKKIAEPSDTYMKEHALKLVKNRDILIQELISSKFDIDMWIPKGGSFILVDISRVQVDEKYLTDQHGNKRTKDWAFCHRLANEEKVVAIPCSPFYSEEEAHLGANFVRFAFCKEADMIRDAGKRMK